MITSLNPVALFVYPASPLSVIALYDFGVLDSGVS